MSDPTTKPPTILDEVADKVLTYRPKPKSEKAAQRRTRRASAKRRQRRLRDSCL